MANLRRDFNGFLSSLSGIQIGLILVSSISLIILAMLSIPHISGLSVALLEIWAVLSAWLAPPYLFIAVHFIIIVIWKLDQKPPRDHPWAPHQNQQPAVAKPKQPLSSEMSPEISRGVPNKVEEWSPPGEPAAVPKPNLSGEISPGMISREEPEQFQWDPPAEQSLPKQRLSREISPKKSPNVSHRGSFSNESCLTEDESTASSRFEMRRSERPQLASDREFVRRLEPEEEEPAVIEEEEEEVDVDDSMDATWKAIMEKTPRPVVPTPRPAPEMETSVGADEMNRRFEDFIRKSRDQIRLQMEEPRRRQMAMANAAF